MAYIGSKPTPVPLTSSDITDGIITSTKIADGSIATADIADAAVTKVKTSGVSSNPFRNIIINGDMSIAQRGTSSTGITGQGYNTIDRFETHASSLGTWTQSQSTDVPTGQGFATSLKMDCTTADASPASNDVNFLIQRFEGQNLQYLKKGSSSAESTTLSFWVRSNKTGTYIAELYDIDNNRTISNSYTISSADTWEKKTLTYAGDTTGAFGNDNGRSLDVAFWLGSGTTYTSGTLQTSWGSQTNANRAVGQVNLADNTANEFYITGVQLEAGTTASDFEFLPVDVNLQRCQRYCYSEPSGQTYHAVMNGFINSSTLFMGVLNLPTSMRSTPSLTTTGNWQVFRSPSYSISAFSLSDNGVNNLNSVQIRATISGATAGDGAGIRNNNDATATFILSSEL